MILHINTTGKPHYELEPGELILEKQEVKELGQYLTREFIPHDLVHAKAAVRKIVHLSNVIDWFFEKEPGTEDAKNNTSQK